MEIISINIYLKYWKRSCNSLLLNALWRRDEFEKVINVHRQTRKTREYWLGEWHASSLSNQILVVQHCRIPLQLQEVKQFPHFLLRVKHEVLVSHGQTSVLPGDPTLLEHGLHGAAPLGQTVSVAVQVKARDGDLCTEAEMSAAQPLPRTQCGHLKEPSPTFRDIMEWTVARPSRSMSTNLALGKMCARYERDFKANGSLLHRRGAGSPWPTITWKTRASSLARVRAWRGGV